MVENILPILAGLKGKVLDAINYERLKAAFELQNDNIEQLKTNNATIRERDEFHKQKIASLETELSTLRARLTTVEKQSPPVPPAYEPSGVAAHILELYKKYQKVDLREKFIQASLKLSDLQMSAALRELQSNGMLKGTSIIRSVEGGANYRLTERGEKFIL